MTHVMLDLETYGTNVGCPVLAIGAVTFAHVKAMLPAYTFYGVAHADQQEYGLMPEPTTVAWWEEQSEEARRVFNDPAKVDLKVLLTRFAAWLPDDAIIWGNGAGFDQPILAAAYRAVGLPLPWKFYNERCYRTLKNMASSVVMKRQGTYHNALDDASSQAAHLKEIVEKLGLELG